MAEAAPATAPDTVDVAAVDDEATVPVEDELLEALELELLLLDEEELLEEVSDDSDSLFLLFSLSNLISSSSLLGVPSGLSSEPVWPTSLV